MGKQHCIRTIVSKSATRMPQQFSRRLFAAFFSFHTVLSSIVKVVGGQSVASGSATFGFKIAEGDTFDVAYSLTLVRSSAEPLHPHEVGKSKRHMSRNTQKTHLWQ